MSQMTTYFDQLVASNHLVHGYAFTGDDQAGKEATSQHLIQALACPNFEDNQTPCKVCDICRRIEANQFPDAFYLQPDGRYIKVDQIRDLKQWLATSSVESGFKIAVVEQADTMNQSAANALLAFLEEPVHNVYIILYSGSLSGLIPTIQSRVQAIHFKGQDALNRSQVLESQGINRSHAHILSQMASDTIEPVVDQYDESDTHKWFKALNSFYSSLYLEDEMAFVLVQMRLKPYLKVQQALFSADYLLLLNHSAMKLALNSDQVEDTIQTYFLQDIAGKKTVSIDHLLYINKGLLKLKERIQSNVTPQLAYEQLTIESVYSQLTK